MSAGKRPPLKKPITLADGAVSQVHTVFYSTDPPGTWRVGFKHNGKNYGCKATYDPVTEMYDEYVPEVKP